MTNKKNTKKNNKPPPRNRNQNKPRNGNSSNNNAPFRTTGSTIGSIFGPLGRSIGGALGAAAGSIFGSGDYYMPLPPSSSNSIVNRSQPHFNSSHTTNNGCIIRRREYIGDIVTGTNSNFVNTQYTINPGNATTFPFLSIIAQCYEQYRFHGLLFEYKSASADSLSASNSGLGTVSFATQYDVLDAAFVSKMQIENYDMSQSAKPSVNQLHGIECARSEQSTNCLYVRPGSVPAGADARFYDMGKLNVAVSGGQQSSASTWGELYVIYDVELLKPKLPETIGGKSESVHLSTSGVVIANPAGTAVLFNTGTLTATRTSGTVITVSGMTTGAEYLLNVAWKGDFAAAVSIPTFVYSTGVTSENGFWNNTQPNLVIPELPAGVSDSRTLGRLVRLVAANTSFTLTLGTGGVFPTTNCDMDFYLVKLDNVVDV